MMRLQQCESSLVYFVYLEPIVHRIQSIKLFIPGSWQAIRPFVIYHNIHLKN